MSLESLANELLLDIFEFLSTLHLLQIFYDLNHRFRTLLFKHFRSHAFDLRSISRQDFDTVCRQYLPSLIGDITSLRLSNGNDTPQLTDRFLAHGFTFCQFTHLQSLSLCHIRADDTVSKKNFLLHHLPNLTHLTFDQCCFRHEKDPLFFMNSIWSLPKLIYCYFDVSPGYPTDFRSPTLISTTLQYLCIKRVDCRISELTFLFKHTPRLERLSISSNIDSTKENLDSIVPSMDTLNISFDMWEYGMLVNFFNKMPNLCQLTVRVYRLIIDGHKWEKIIRNYLPKLKRFRFQMDAYLNNDENIKQQVDELMDTFRSRFWLDEHQWYVRCHWESNQPPIILYSLPYAFDEFHVGSFGLSKSTYPFNDHDYWTYDHVRSFSYHSSFVHLALPHIRFSMIRELSVNFLFNDKNFWSIFPNFDRLTSLHVQLDDGSETCQSQVQALLDRAPHLYSLSFYKDSLHFAELTLFESRCLPIRQLDLQDECYTNEECAQLCRSALGKKCEVLLITVEDRICVLDLVNAMTNLRGLNVICENEDYDEESEDELVEWLRQRLPSSCLITRDAVFYSIRIWIR